MWSEHTQLVRECGPFSLIVQGNSWAVVFAGQVLTKGKEENPGSNQEAAESALRKLLLQTLHQLNNSQS